MILGRPYVVLVSIGIQLILIYANRRAPAVQPELVKNRFTDWVNGISIVLTGFMFSVFPANAPILLMAAVLALSSICPPLVGRAENKLRTHGKEIFALNRFKGHVASNIAGGAAALLFFAAASTTPGLVAYASSVRDATSAFNVVLPLSSMVVFAFVRWQQMTDCREIDELVANNDDWASQIRGSSLTAWNQIANTIHLLIVNFIGASSVLYLFGYVVLRAKAHRPLEFTWQMGCAMALLVLFLLVCGSPLLWEYRAVYLTFLTGTPGVIIAAMIWLSLLQPSASRNVFAVLLIALGYLTYCALAILGLIRGQGQSLSVNKPASGDDMGSVRPQDGVELFYFSATIFALALAVLLGALYFSTITPP